MTCYENRTATVPQRSFAEDSLLERWQNLSPAERKQAPTWEVENLSGFNPWKGTYDVWTCKALLCLHPIDPPNAGCFCVGFIYFKTSQGLQGLQKPTRPGVCGSRWLRFVSVPGIKGKLLGAAGSGGGSAFDRL